MPRLRDDPRKVLRLLSWHAEEPEQLAIADVERPKSQVEEERDAGDDQREIENRRRAEQGNGMNDPNRHGGREKHGHESDSRAIRRDASEPPLREQRGAAYSWNR